ncbi:MAG: nucleotide exchange factor GrpE [Lysobacteraceae bacterium]|nr:MAG: nucleotide exchange factor GrpE [Xanthomonadaceae bacterium]
MTHDPIEQEAQEANERAIETPQIDEAEVLRAELEQLRAHSLLERADLENQRKRMAREVEMARKFANERLLGDLLPVLDSLDAGLASTGKAGDVFDPERHQAMSMIDAEGVAPGAVAQTFQKGYVLNERLLRPALVVVARHD